MLIATLLSVANSLVGPMDDHGWAFLTIAGLEHVFLGWREKEIGLGISPAERMRAIGEFFFTTLKGAKASNVGRTE